MLITQIIPASRHPSHSCHLNSACHISAGRINNLSQGEREEIVRSSQLIYTGPNKGTKLHQSSPDLSIVSVIIRNCVLLCRTYQAARQAAQDLADRAQLHSMQRAFSAWRIANASLQHQRSSLLNLCIQLALEGRLSATFTSWRVIARSRRQAVLEARRLEAQHRCCPLHRKILHGLVN